MFHSADKSVSVHRGRKILAALLVFILWTTFLFPVFADSGITGLSLKTHPANDRYLSLSFDFTSGGRTYTAFLTGIRTDADASLWAQPLAEEIAHSFSAGKKLRIASRKTGKPNEYVLSGVDLMDVEKQNLEEPEECATGEVPTVISDSLLCWAAAASNALELSGWGRAVTEMNPGKVDFKNEDDVFAYFASNFMDSGSLAIEGEKWFLTGMQIDESTDPQTGEPSFGVYHWIGAQLWEKGSGGLAKEFCAADVTSQDYDKLYAGMRHWATPAGLAQGADDLEKGYGVSLGIEFLGSLGGHDLTMTGTIREKTSGGSGKVVALFLADSDNDAPTYDYNDPAAEQAAGPRSKRVNSFEMYPIRESRYEGETGVCVDGFWMHPESDTIIADIMSVRPYSAGLPKEPTGTKDVYASPDMVPVVFRLGEEAMSYAETTVGTPLEIRVNLNNQSYVPITAKASATVNIRYLIFKDGKQIDTLQKNVVLTGKQLFPLSRDHEGTDVWYTFREPGKYTIGVEILGLEDADGPIREAYTHNNSLKDAWVTVSDVPPLPPTGDQSNLLLCLVLLTVSLSGTLLCLRRKS